MQFKPSVWRDIQKYYQGTFVKFKEFGEKLFYIDVVNAGEIHGKDEDENPFILYLVEEAPYTLEYVLPSRATFNYKGSAYMLQRVPARQYQRGLSTGNTRLIEIPSGKAQSVNFPALKAFVEKQVYPTIKDAIYGKGKEKVLAVSSRMSFSRPHQALFVDCVQVATFDRARSLFKVNPLFKPELQELIAKDSWTVEIVNA
jgi:hypothetical protein